jgi:predicted DNA binding CopG/RHH family protein
MAIEKELPIFASETEEANWWCEHRHETDAYMAEMIVNGTARSLQDFLREEGLLVEVEAVTMHLVTDDATRAKNLALRKGMSYEEFLASLVHEGIARAEAA